MARTSTVKIDVVDRTYRAEIEYSYFKGYAGSSIEPPEPPHVVVDSVTLLDASGKYLETPSWLADLIAESDYVRDELIEYALEDF
jgi:hypothetical protein